jgi:predicted TIM-barrel fold metal-dependent hydrolase
MVDPRLGLDQPAFARSCGMLDSGRVWVKLSGPMRAATRGGDCRTPSMTPLRARAGRAVRARALLWGSDWPHVQMKGRVMPNDGDLLGLLGEWVPDEAHSRLAEPWRSR